MGDELERKWLRLNFLFYRVLDSSFSLKVIFVIVKSYFEDNLGSLRERGN